MSNVDNVDIDNVDIDEGTDLAELRDLKKILIDVSKQVYRELRVFYQSENKLQRRKLVNSLKEKFIKIKPK